MHTVLYNVGNAFMHSEAELINPIPTNCGTLNEITNNYMLYKLKKERLSKDEKIIIFTSHIGNACNYGCIAG